MSESEGRSSVWRWVIGGIAALLALGLLGWLIFGWFKNFVVFRTFGYALESITDATGASPYLVKGILVLVLGPFFLALREIGKLWPFRAAGVMSRKVAWAVAVAYVSAFFFTMYFASRDQYFHHNAGKVSATKFYALTPEGVRFFDTPGIDPKYGIELKPVTPQLLANLKKRELGLLPKPLVYKSPSEVAFFDSLTGEPKVWYHRNPAGQIELFSPGGFHPGYGEELKPVTREMVSEIERQAGDRATAEKREIEATEFAKRRAEADRYAGPAVAGGSGRKTAAILVLADGSGAALEEDVERALKARDVVAVRGFFKPSFVSEGRAAALLAGDWEVAQRLLLVERVDAVVVGQVHSVFSASTEFEGLTTASTSLELKCLALASQQTCGQRTISVKGAGFGKGAALENALSNVRAPIEGAVRAFRF